MKKYCSEVFRVLTKESFAKEDSEFTGKVQNYLNEFKKKDTEKKKNGITDAEWKEHGISDEKKLEYERRLIDYREKYIIDVPMEAPMKEKDRFIIDFLNWDTKVFLENLITTNAVYWDFINEMYLALCRMSSEEGKLLEHSFFEDEEKKEKARDYLKNYNRPNTYTSAWIPFSKMPQNMSKEINSFGIDIMCFWVYSKEFRNLFQEVADDNISDKYEINTFIKCIDGGRDIIGKKIENSLILDKLIGGSLIKAFYNYIDPYIREFGKDEFKCIEDLIQNIMKLEGNCIRCKVIEYIGIELSIIQDVKSEYVKKRIQLYNLYLEEIVPTVNKQYKELCSIWLDEIKECCSFDYWVYFIASEKRNMEESDDEYRRICKIDYSNLHFDFKKSKNENGSENGIIDYNKLVFWGKIECENEKIMQRVIKKVIDINREKY